MIKITCQTCLEAYPPWADHVCPKTAKPASKPRKPAQRHMANSMANSPDMANRHMANSGDDMANMPSTYRYRDADARRAYQRDYMRRRRGK